MTRDPNIKGSIRTTAGMSGLNIVHYLLSLISLLPNLRSLYLQQCQPGVQHHQDVQGHECKQLEGLEG